MRPTTEPKKRTPLTGALAALLGVVIIATVGLSATAEHKDDHETVAAVITVVFTPDDMGFEAISSKDLSNIIVQYCNLTWHKHDGLTVKVFNHTETSLIKGVWVKSGNNGIEGNNPPGAGAFFANAGVVCSPATTTPASTPATTAPETTPATTAPETTPASNTTVTTAPTTEIPFFPSATALALGTLGALAAGFVMMRRRN